MATKPGRSRTWQSWPRSRAICRPPIRHSPEALRRLSSWATSRASAWFALQPRSCGAKPGGCHGACAARGGLGAVPRRRRHLGHLLVADIAGQSGQYTCGARSGARHRPAKVCTCTEGGQHNNGIIHSLEGFAQLALAQGQAQRAASAVWCCYWAQRAQIGVSDLPGRAPESRAPGSRHAQATGQAGLACRHRRAGQALSIEQAIAYALEEP